MVGDNYTSQERAIEFEGDNGYSEFDNNNVKIDAVTGIAIYPDGTCPNIDISNDESNNYDEVVEIYLNDGTRLFKTDYLTPGDKLDSVVLNTNSIPHPGVYKGVAVYSFYTKDSHSFVNSCEIPIEINFVNIG